MPGKKKLATWFIQLSCWSQQFWWWSVLEHTKGLLGRSKRFLLVALGVWTDLSKEKAKPNRLASLVLRQGYLMQVIANSPSWFVIVRTPLLTLMVVPLCKVLT